MYTWTASVSQEEVASMNSWEIVTGREREGRGGRGREGKERRERERESERVEGGCINPSQIPFKNPCKPSNCYYSTL